jgi:hypothetical protein
MQSGRFALLAGVWLPGALRPSQAVQKSQRVTQPSGQGHDGGGDDGLWALDFLGMQKQGDFAHGGPRIQKYICFYEYRLETRASYERIVCSSSKIVTIV